MILEWNFTDNFLEPLGRFGGWFMVILGIMWIIYAAYETKRRKSFKRKKVEDWDFDITKFLKALTYIGFFVGILCLISGISELILDIPPSETYKAENYPEEGRNVFTAILLIIFGILTFMKPANDLPLASIIGVLAASAVVIVLAFAIPEGAKKAIGIIVDPRIFFAVIFIIVFALVALIAKFYMSGFMAVSKLISWPPLAVIFAIFCFIQGFLLLVIGVSISGYF